MSEKLHTAILHLRASVLQRCVRQKGYELSATDARELVSTRDDQAAYHEAIQQVQRPVSFWNRFWWAR